jgi:ketosteroid isomerase-like protein
MIDAATHAAIEELENGLQGALMGPDLGWFEQHWEPDALYVHMSGGVDDTQAFIERLRSKATVYEGREAGDLQLRRYGDAVVATGWSHVDILVSGEPRSLDTRFTRVYVKHGDEWRLASSQSGANKFLQRA